VEVYEAVRGLELGSRGHPVDGSDRATRELADVARPLRETGLTAPADATFETGCVARNVSSLCA